MIKKIPESELRRKILHITFSVLLFLPYEFRALLPGWLDLKMVYAVVIAATTWIYAVRVRGVPRIVEDLRRRMMELELARPVEKILLSIESLIKTVERDYEKRAGWLGLLSGAVGIGASYLIFGGSFVAGVMAMVMFDGLSPLFSHAFGTRRIPYTKGTLEGTLAAFTVLFLSMCFITSPLNSLIVTIVASLSELYGVEDNITVPLASSAVYFLLRNV